MSTAGSQLNEIHAMLTNGQRSIRVEPHTLLLWGLAGVFSILVFELIINPEKNFAVRWHGELVAAIFFAIVLLLTGIMDHRMTKRVRNQRDESLPFVHRQLRKMVYLLFTLIVAIYLGMIFHGGWKISIGIYFALIGVGFFVYGLFSVQILSWVGVLLITMGIVCVAIKLTHPATTCLFGSVLGIGIPVLALVLNKPHLHNKNKQRIFLSFVWVLLVVVPAMMIYQLIGEEPVNLPVVSLQEYMNQTETDTQQIIQLHKGTEVPIRIHLTGDTIEELVTTTILPAVFSRDVDVLAIEGKLDRFLPDNFDDWDQQSIVHIWSDLRANLTRAQGPVLDYTLHYNIYTE